MRAKTSTFIRFTLRVNVDMRKSTRDEELLAHKCGMTCPECVARGSIWITRSEYEKQKVAPQRNESYTFIFCKMVCVFGFLFMLAVLNATRRER